MASFAFLDINVSDCFLLPHRKLPNVWWQHVSASTTDLHFFH